MNAATTPCEQETGLSLKELMMLPVILLWLTFQVFARHVATLKEMRRTKPMPINWREHWPNLRLAEWHIRSLTSFGIKALLAGQELDLQDLPMVLDPPEDHYAPMPGSALEMHRRFEAAARFHADPERYIRRAAERITAREGEIDPLGRTIRPPPPPSPPLVVVLVVVVVVFLPTAGFSAQRIRAPPWLAGNSQNQTRPNPLIPSARTRDHA